MIKPQTAWTSGAGPQAGLRWIKGVSSLLVYPIAERVERRTISRKLAELRAYYRLSATERRRHSRDRLAEVLAFAGAHVPYYRDVFARIRFDPQLIRRDEKYIEELPYLTKDIIAEQGKRLLSRPLDRTRHHICRSGGTTGRSCVVFYDQPAADYAAAVTLYCREQIGSTKSKAETHFAARLPGPTRTRERAREAIKCLAMNRSNIRFDRYDNDNVERMWQELLRQRPYLAHAHPSTMYSIARYVERRYGGGKAFEVFESSGELLDSAVREVIARILSCRVVDRYGLAEMGVVAYELSGHRLEILTSEVYAEVDADHDPSGAGELVLTGLRNRLMPLIRYRTGDIARVEASETGVRLTDLIGRVHDVVPINGGIYPTHHFQDVLQHRVGGVDQFQIDLTTSPPTLRIVLLPGADGSAVRRRVHQAWPDCFEVCLVGSDQLVRAGKRAKFRYVVDA